MAVFEGTIRSKALGMDTRVNVLLPHDRPPNDIANPCRVLYLLHGMGGCSDSWLRYTTIELYARKYGLVVIMPEVQQSMYVDMKLGLPYFTYVSEELPEICANMFNISTRREDTFVAGLSMGGYGAFLLALRRPERFAAAASFSGALDLEYIVEHNDERAFSPQMMAVFGPSLELDDEINLISLAKKVSLMPEGKKPKLYMSCGKQDDLFEMNLLVKNRWEMLSLDLVWEEWDGDHDWIFWEQCLGKAIPWMMGKA